MAQHDSSSTATSPIAQYKLEHVFYYNTDCVKAVPQALEIRDRSEVLGAELLHLPTRWTLRGLQSASVDILANAPGYQQTPLRSTERKDRLFPNVTDKETVVNLAKVSCLLFLVITHDLGR